MADTSIWTLARDLRRRLGIDDRRL